MDERFFQRNRYAERLRLTADDLENQQAYDSGKRQLLNRALVGFGVVYGLEVRSVPSRFGFFIGSGFALDRQGREIFVPEEVFFFTGEIFPKEAQNSDNWYICIRLEERECGEGYILQPNGTHAAVPNRVEEGYKILALQNPNADEIRLARVVISLDEKLTPAISAVFSSEKTSILSFQHAETAVGAFRVSTGWESPSGEVFYSEEISHGLGSGNVHITLSVEDLEQERRSIVSGYAGLFGANPRMAIKLFPSSGTFIAAVQLRGRYPGEFMVHWCAQRIENAVEHEAAEPIAPPVSLFHLEPRISLLWTGERVQFFVCAEDGSRRRLNLHFTVQSDGGGEIDDSGLYTAPKTAGTYKIRAVCADEPQKLFDATVIVFERT